MKESTDMLDICKYESLRVPSLVFFTFGFLMNVVYFSHSSIVAEIGFNPTLNQFLMSISELSCLPLILFVYSKVARKVSSILLVLLGTVCSLVSIFIKVPANCEDCVTVFVQVGLAMVARFCIISSFALNNMMIAEFYPTSISKLAVGIMSLNCVLGTLVSVILFTDSNEFSFSPYLLITLLMLAIGIVLFMAPETLGNEPQDQIQEVKELEEKLKEQ